MINAKKRAGDDMPELSFRSPQVLSKTYGSTVFDVYLDDEIGSPEKYREIYNVLSTASPQDIVVLHVNSNGGRMDAGVQIINHIKNCKAKVIGVLHMECASMASAIFLACHDWELNTFSTMMVHSCSYGAVGKQSDIRSRVEFTTKFNEKYVRETYEGFLRPEEVDRVLKGDDVYFDAEQIDERLESLRKFREEKEAEAAEQAVDAIVAKVKKPAKAKPVKGA